MVILALVVILIFYQAFFTDATTSMLLKFDGNIGTYFTEELASLNSRGAEAFTSASISSASYFGEVYFKDFIPISYVQLLGSIFIYFLLLRKLYGLLKSSAKGDFFNKENVKRLNWIGVLFIAWWVYGLINERLSKYVFETYLSSTRLTTSSSRFDLLPNFLENNLLIGLMILMIAQAFSYGLKLKEEQELTI